LAAQTCDTASPSCYCPVYSASGEACTVCLETISPALASAYSSASSACATPCSAECNNVWAVIETCTATTAGLAEYGCYCPAYLSSGLACSSCLATLDPTYASGIGSAATVCSATLCYNECASLYLLSCNGVASCYCPVYQASAAACSACVAGNFPTYAAGLASILTTDCSGAAATVAGVTTAAAQTANPAGSSLPSQTQAPTANPTGPSQTQAVAGTSLTHSGARGGFEGIVGEHYIGIIMAIAIVASFWSLFM